MKLFACIAYLSFVWITLLAGDLPDQFKQPLSIGRSTFSRIIEDNCVYVDKTGYINKLLNSKNRYFFIARPRQFGRTLFLTTLEAFFAGKKDLFKTLNAAKSNYSWQQSPVIVLNFLGTCAFNKQEFEQYLCRYIKSIAEQYQIELENENIFSSLFRQLVSELTQKYGKNNIVLLVDEYDKPMLDRIDSKEQYSETERILKRLYDVVGECDDCWRFVFITGLTKCSKQIVLSGIPTLFDISENDEYTAIFGFSKKYLINIFKPMLLTYTKSQRQCLDAVVDLIASRCGGYNFSCNIQQTEALINPRSALYQLYYQDSDNYFFDGCTPSFLVKILKQKQYSFELSSPVRVKKENFEIYDQQTILPEVALYASGYLTICGYDKKTNEYLLKIPNTGVKQAFHFLQKALDKICI
ncbi:MAG: AAA-ATPase [candidate division TM6 bacterium GW2011_GWF2_37_49]|nr:MAG: AAA-ATPase [candidate division TM6 bacterium GW2011_GWF2_37_49]